MKWLLGIYVIEFILGVVHGLDVVSRMAVGGEELSAFLNEKPSLHELCEHVTIGTKWFLFGVLLKLDERALDAIEELNKDVANKSMKMFRLWLDTNPYATRRQVIDTLRMNTIKENTIAETYESTD